MKALVENPNPGLFFRRLFVLCFPLFLSIQASAQFFCDCPAPTSCGPCQGGLVSLTLQSSSLVQRLVTVTDQKGTLFSGNVAAGASFTITGSTPNENFSGNSIHIKVLGLVDINIGTNCNDNPEVGDKYGIFTIMAGKSKNGGAICCKPSDYDDKAPEIRGCPPNRNVNLPPASCTVAVNWPAPTVRDDCTVQSFETNYAPGYRFPIGNTEVVYTAKDKNGNTSSCSFTVSVIDVIRPDIRNCPPTITVAATTSCEAVATWIPPTVTDNCSVTMTSTHDPGDSFPIGTTKVIYTAKDGYGNTATCTFDIHVTDNTRPVFTGCPDDVTVSASADCEATASWAPPTVKDNCTPVVVSSSHKPGTKFKLGTTSVTYTARDERNNTSTCSFNVTVIKTDTPVITDCPAQSLTVPSDEHGEAVVTWREPRASVGCGEVSVERSHKPGSTFRTGTTSVIYTFTSDARKTATCSFDVIVLQPEIKVDVARAVTPDGDGIHDRWELTHIERYQDNIVLVIDRWGNKIFEARGYDNERIFWDGKNQQGSMVPTGTYFYTIEVRAQETVWKRKGSLEVIQ